MSESRIIKEDVIRFLYKVFSERNLREDLRADMEEYFRKIMIEFEDHE